LTRLRLDALPDITNKQVMINYAAPALGPEDVEKRITFPIEAAIFGSGRHRKHAILLAQWLRPGDCDFREDANLYFMRQQVAERLAQAKPNLPPGVEPQLDLCPQALARFSCTALKYANPGGDGARVWQWRTRMAERRFILGR